ncbi:cell wall-binding repeat-containing protein [Mesobacillus jeotgali]|uniref:cell wall-binding repeat-containing protein n=1 Tax=Mesobacillus jeotgali TaxID=129985 RepID=UPI001CFEB701|nr:cell wall-binding repeat-containing protein [Mesobacillus jeotgali]
MKPIKKLTSSLSVVAMLASLTIAPNVMAAEKNPIDYGQELKSHQLVSQLKERNVLPISGQGQAFSASATVTKAVYTNKIDMYSAHEYFFVSSGGQFTVNNLDEVNVMYEIYNNDTFEDVAITANDTYNLPAGNYSIIVSSDSDILIDYKIELNGTFNGQPDATLPTLQVASPSSHELRLAKGSSATYAVKGTSNAEDLWIFDNFKEYNPANPLSFNQNITLEKGLNGLYFYAVNASGNAIASYYDISLPGISRIAGKDRYAVSAGVSKQLDKWGHNSGTVIIARGDMFPDALSGGPLAEIEGAPMLLTYTNTLPADIVNQIKDLGADRAIILGGSASVSSNVEGQLKNLGVTDIERIDGKDRYVVSAKIAERVTDYSGSDTAIIASAEVFPDALSASTIAGPTGMPILLVKKDTITDPVKSFISSHPEIKNFIVVGGPKTVQPAVLGQLPKGAFVERIDGMDRYEVAINVAKFGMEHFGMDLSTLTVVRGDLFPDALSGAPLANYQWAPILLTTSSKLEGKVNTFLQSNQSQIDNIYILGGTASVSSTTEQQLNGHIR